MDDFPKIETEKNPWAAMYILPRIQKLVIKVSNFVKYISVLDRKRSKQK